jgi:hypothetical protein
VHRPSRLRLAEVFVFVVKPEKIVLDGSHVWWFVNCLAKLVDIIWLPARIESNVIFARVRPQTRCARSLRLFRLFAPQGVDGRIRCFRF